MPKSKIIPSIKPKARQPEPPDDDDDEDEEDAPAPPKKDKKPDAKKASKSSEVADPVQEILDGLRADGDDDGIAFRLDSDDHGLHIRGVISTRCYGLDQAIGRGGIPLSRLTLLHGAESSGKTTLCLQACAQVQAEGGIALYMDKEYKLDPDYAAALGVDLSRLILSQPPDLETAFELMKGAIKRRDAIAKKTGKYIPLLIVLDSMNAAVTKAIMAGDFSQSHMASQARVFSQSLPKLMPTVNGSDTALLWVSQVRKKMNVTYGNDEELSGGNAPKFYAALIIKVKRIGAFKVGDETQGNKTQVACTKNQVAPPFKKADFVIRYGFGVDNEMSIIEEAVKAKVLKKHGAWFWFGDPDGKGFKIGAGLLKAADLLREKPRWKERIMEALPKDALAAKALTAGDLEGDDDDDDDDDEADDD